MAPTKLFQPLTVGTCPLQHRIIMAPLTRFRADDNHTPLPSVTEYYTQRASTPGSLLIAEATHISPRHCGGPNTAGIWSASQIASWRNVTDSVHAKGCFIYCQLIAPGRAGSLEGFPLLSSSEVAMEGGETPRGMREEEIWDCIVDFKQAAKNAMEAGFDGVELHGANGYLIDQFTQDVCNQRTDAWGGSIENRSRFAVEATKACIDAIGADRVAVRLSPWNTWQSMKMDVPLAIQQFSDLISRLRALHISYLHLIESRVINNVDCEKQEGLEFAFDIWRNVSPVFVAGGFTPERARQAVDEEYKDSDVCVTFGRYFVSTPDLVFRVREGLQLNGYDRDTFYTPMTNKGYTDYPFSKEFLAMEAAKA